MKCRLAARVFAGALSLTFVVVTAISADAQFPINQSFKTDTATNWTLSGNALLTGDGAIDPVGSGWLRLTRAAFNQAGSALYDLPFASTDGIVVEFDYATYGGSGADGFSFYLIDGATAVPTLGAEGQGLGYANSPFRAIRGSPTALSA